MLHPHAPPPLPPMGKILYSLLHNMYRFILETIFSLLNNEKDNVERVPFSEHLPSVLAFSRTSLLAKRMSKR